MQACSLVLQVGWLPLQVCIMAMQPSSKAVQASTVTLQAGKTGKKGRNYGKSLEKAFRTDDSGVRRQSGSGDGAFGRTGNKLDAEDFRACESGVALAPWDNWGNWRGVRWHDIAFGVRQHVAFPRRDMSRRTKARTCPRTPKPHWRGRNLEGGFLPNAATPKRICRRRREESLIKNPKAGN